MTKSRHLRPRHEQQERSEHGQDGPPRTTNTGNGRQVLIESDTISKSIGRTKRQIITHYHPRFHDASSLRVRAAFQSQSLYGYGRPSSSRAHIPSSSPLRHLSTKARSPVAPSSLPHQVYDPDTKRQCRAAWCCVD